MDIGVIGLGRMGAIIARRLLAANCRVIGHDVDRDAVGGLDGIVISDGVTELVDQLQPPRIVWVMLPAGEPTQEMLDSLGRMLSAGDVIVDGGNSFYGDSVRQGARLGAAGIGFVDVGVSGGVWGLRDGYGLLVGGEQWAVNLVGPALEAIAAADGLALVGPAGGGHFAKMVHNAVEYGVLEAYAEGYEVLAASDLELDAQAAIGVWASACSIRSFLLEKMAHALEHDPQFASVQGWVDDSGMGRWTIADTVRLGVPAPALTAALHARFRSRQHDSPAMRAIAATRKEVGGHAVKTTHEPAPGSPPETAAGGASRWLRTIHEEIRSALEALSLNQIVALENAILQARRIYVAGQGRSGLIGRGFAQRLMHIGCESYAVGDIIAPAVGVGDLLVAISASGATETTLHQACKARAAGAFVLAVVQARGGQLDSGADSLLLIPTGPPSGPSVQHSTTLFCQVVQITFDVVCAMVQRELRQSDEQLIARHSNLE